VVFVVAMTIFLSGLSGAGFVAVRVAERDRAVSSALSAAISFQGQVRAVRPEGPLELQDVLEKFEADQVESVAVIGPHGMVVASSEPFERGRVEASPALYAAVETGEVQTSKEDSYYKVFLPVRHLRGMRPKCPHCAMFGHCDCPPPDPWGPLFGDIVLRLRIVPGSSWLWHWVMAQAVASGLVIVALWAGLIRARRTARLLWRAETEKRRREVLARLGEVSAVLAHEIRNPIAAAKGQVQLALEAAGLQPSEMTARLGTALSEVERVERLVRGLLDYARERPLARRKVPVSEVVSMAMAHGNVGDGRVEVTGDLGADVEVDPDQLGRALANLLANAVEAAGPAGRVRLSVRLSGGALHVVVEDSGPGVPEGLKDRIFDPFVTGKVHGVGLGLAVTRDVVEAHGGTIKVARSAELGGAMFEFTIPR